jgi:RNA polymerase sigma-70 factor (ECF subfamily)
MERVRLGDSRAFEAIYDEHHRLVYSIAMRLLREAAAAEDVAQWVFLKIWTQPGAFQNGNLAAWIGRVTRNKCLDVLRDNARHLSAERKHESQPAQTPEAFALSYVDSMTIRHALCQIPTEQRTVIELAYFAGMTRHGIAQSTGVPVGTVKTRIRTGLHRLREILQAAEA